MSPPINVAVAGATGSVGSNIVRALLSSTYFPATVGRVVILTRDPSSIAALELKTLGAELVQTTEPIADVLRGIDVFVNALSSMAPMDLSDTYAKAAAEAGVKVYLPSEYTLDHYKYPFDNPFFIAKQKHDKFARELDGGKLKVVTVLNAIFPEIAFGPPSALFGLDIKGRSLTAVGSPDTKVSFTSHADVGWTVARVAVLAMNEPASIPDRVRVAGDSKSFKEIAEVVREKLGGEVEVKSIDIEEYKKTAKEGHFKIVRLSFGAGEVDFSRDNHNDIINPGGKLWAWKTVEEYIKTA